MSVVLRVGAVYPDYNAGCTDADSYDDGNAAEDYSRPSSQSFPGCFGLPYQDHNYGAPPPASPPPRIPSPAFIDKINGHIEVEEISVTSVGQQASVDVTSSDAVDDSITRCICDFTHDDGYMICCDKCSVWQHIDCMAVDRTNIPESYFCEICEPRSLDRDRARQIQLRKREFILAADSSTDTDPDEPVNRRMSQDMGKKGKPKKRTKILKSKDDKVRRTKKDKKDIKKEKENKDLSRRLRISLKERDSTSKKNIKNKMGKKSGFLSLITNDNAQQDPWDSSYSPWVDKYEEAKENQYSADMQAILGLKKLNGSLTCSGNFNYKRNGRLLVQLCHVTEVNKNRKGLEASETIGEGEPIIEYTGNVMLREQFDKANFYKRLNPFVLFNSMFDNIELCIDATTYGNIARFIRRSCKSNAEVKHTFEDGELTFIVVSTKVIPRGSEITIPYDYNYKECTYCVECACLRNNCPVAKYFKRKQNAQNKKEKEKVVQKNVVKAVKTPTTPVKVINHQPKSPRSPAASLPRSPVKSPIRKSISIEEPIIKEEIDEVKPEVPPPPPPPVVSPVKESVMEERLPEVKEEIPQDPSTDSGTDHQDTHSESEENPSTERTRRLSREDRKMEAIMKAFEKMEKRQERRKEALARMDHTTKKPAAIGIKQTEEPKKEKLKAKCQEPKETKETRTSERISNAEEAKKEKAKIVEKVEVKPIVEEPVPTLPDPPALPVTPVLPITPALPVKKELKVSHKKKKKSSSKRKSRINSSNIVKSEPQSQDESSNTTPSCPSTPVSAPPDVSNTPPSFKFLKTKKHLMNEWLSEKSQDVVPSLPPPPPSGQPSGQPSKIEPLEVQVEEDTMYVACRPSPRNALDHLRRNSTSAGCSPYSNLSSSSKQESSIGSAKKRWLRQAMFDKPVPQKRSLSPLGLAGGTSPNPHVSLPSPGGSPPGDYITPLKKRRLASYRESIDQPPTPSAAQSVVSSDQAEEFIDVQNPDPVCEAEMGLSKVNRNASEASNKPKLMDSLVRHSVESVCSNHRTSSDSQISADEGEKVTSHLESVSSNTDSVMESSNECDSQQEDDSVERNIDVSDNRLEAMEVDSTQSDSEKKEAVCDSTCKVEDNRACSSSITEASLVDSSSDVGVNEETNANSVEMSEINVSQENVGSSNVSQVLDSQENVGSSNVSELLVSQENVGSSSVSEVLLPQENVGSSNVADISISQGNVGSSNVLDIHVSHENVGSSSVSQENICSSNVLQENVGSSSDRHVRNYNFDVSSSSELHHFSSNLVESSQVTENVSVSSTEQTCSSYSATSEGGGMADSSMSENKTDLSDMGLADVSAVGDSTQYVNNTSATDSVGEPVASSSMAEDSGIMLEPLTPQESHGPSKKKVSLLEYRKRQKEKTPVSTSTPSSSRPSSTTIIAPSSTTSPIHRHHRFSTLPSLPLFDSSPTKDNSSRYHFKSSSDLIRKRSIETKEKRPQLSLSERLRMEFGLEDSEEEKDVEKDPSHHRQTSLSSSHIPPPPPPPPKQEPSSAPVSSSVFQHPQFPQPSIMLRGPSPVLAQNGPQPTSAPIMTTINGVPGPVGPSSVMPQIGTPHMLVNGTQSPVLPPQSPVLLPHPSNSSSGGKSIPSLLSIKTFPTRNLPNGNESGTTPPSSGLVDQSNLFHSNNQGVSTNQHFAANHINNSPVGFTPPSADMAQSSSQNPPIFNQNGTTSQQNFNGTNMPSNGPIVHEYNHGYNDQPAQKLYHSQDQRKKSNKFKRKHYNSYQDSGGGHFH
ncbi:inactive histone-lysine N-methyltransferase 2E-like isoform X1 [Mytilus californianus]|uniref:inactive histone-lysine N-methyltransferase 2E-like isoform X1 n=1 Tax=Mytilus californianus TaxID=6549 RepID=UPI002247B6ED|nr:inactive histone-lysine N-methyltransferase 2E-like isoform X1 [Mytilus californianus]